MDAQAFLDLLRSNSDSSEDDTLESAKDEDKDHAAHKEVKGEKNPYSNSILEQFIKGVGFEVEEVPRFTEMAKKLNTTIKHEPVTKDLTNLDNHDTIEDISPLKRNDAREIEKQALKKLIAKYKG